MVYSTGIKWTINGWNKTENGNRVQRIEYLRSDLDLYQFGTLRNASGALINEMRRLISKVVPPVILPFPEAIIQEEDDKKLLVATAALYLMMINRRFTVFMEVLLSTVAGM